MTMTDTAVTVTEATKDTRDEEMAHQIDMASADVREPITWRPSVPAEVTRAKEAFDLMIRGGNNIYILGCDGVGDEKATEFDPNVASYLAIPHIQGG